MESQLVRAGDLKIGYMFFKNRDKYLEEPLIVTGIDEDDQNFILFYFVSDPTICNQQIRFNRLIRIKI